MFPLQQGDELCFKISSNPHQQHDKIPQDLILAQYSALHGSSSSTDHHHKTNNIEKVRRRKLNSMDNDSTEVAARDHHNNNNDKKVMHRDTERQRRQGMTTLYASLRALLPLEFIKGKRSISDHINQAVNYITHLQKKMKALSAKKEELKKLSDSSSVDSQGGNSNTYPPSSLIIRPCLGGIEIVFNSDLRNQDLPLSRVLRVLLEEGISVVSCVSTKVNDRLFQTVRTEVSDQTCLNLSELRQKLTPLVTSSGDYFCPTHQDSR